MQPIVSGTTTERKGRTLFLTAMLTAFAVWFFYDAWVVYPARNLEAATAALIPRPSETPPLSDDVSAATVKDIRTGQPIGAVLSRIGPAGWHHEREYRWFGPNGTLRVTTDHDAVAEATFLRGEHDTVAQVWLGSIMGALACLMLARAARVFTMRVVLDDAGLTIRRAAPIPFEAMTGIRADRYADKGWVRLDYQRDGKPRSVKLDCDVIDRFRPIIEGLCTRNAWPNPLPPPRSETE